MTEQQTKALNMISRAETGQPARTASGTPDYWTVSADTEPPTDRLSLERGSTMTLKDAALQAERDTAARARDDATQRRETALDELLEKWGGKHGRATIGYNEAAPTLPMPDRDAFTWVGYPGVPYQDGRGRSANAYGWTWNTDGITFMYDAAYQGNGLCVLLTCPDCGERHADHFYGMDGLGKLLRLGRSTSHVCREVATRNLAHAIRQAAEQTGLPPQTIAADAADREEAWPRR